MLNALRGAEAPLFHVATLFVATHFVAMLFVATLFVAMLFPEFFSNLLSRVLPVCAQLYN
jgi:hypothetical protein